MEHGTKGDRAVLLVDDNDDLRETLAELIQAHGYRVATVRNGVEALAWMTCGRRPGLILLDMMMPEMNGWELLERLKADEALATIPVVVVSANADPSAFTMPSLRKPFREEALLRILEEHYGDVR